MVSRDVEQEVLPDKIQSNSIQENILSSKSNLLKFIVL